VAKHYGKHYVSGLAFCYINCGMLLHSPDSFN